MTHADTPPPFDPSQPLTASATDADVLRRIYKLCESDDQECDEVQAGVKVARELAAASVAEALREIRERAEMDVPKVAGEVYGRTWVSVANYDALRDRAVALAETNVALKDEVADRGRLTDIYFLAAQTAEAERDRVTAELDAAHAANGLLVDRAIASDAELASAKATNHGAWQAADSAPKTSEHILVSNVGRGDFGICGGKVQDFAAVVHWWNVAGEEGFYLSNGYPHSVDDETPISFTHWMPVPATPFAPPSGPDEQIFDAIITQMGSDLANGVLAVIASDATLKKVCEAIDSAVDGADWYAAFRRELVRAATTGAQSK